MRKRDYKLNVFLNEEEHNNLNKITSDNNINYSDFIRLVINRFNNKDEFIDVLGRIKDILNQVINSLELYSFFIEKEQLEEVIKIVNIVESNFINLSSK